jgi:uncharacterized integral membrane protein
VKFSYRISLEDYQEAQRLIRKLFAPWLRWIWWAAVALWVLISLFMLYANTQGPEKLHAAWRNQLPLVVILAIYFLSQLLIRFQVKRSYKRNSALHREISVDIDEQRFEADDGAGAKSISPWDHYDRFLEGKRVFVFSGPSKICLIVSKSNMTTEQATYVRHVLTASVHR